MIEIGGQRVLRVGVLAAASLENQLDLDVRLLPLLEVDDRHARSEIVAGVLAGDRIDGVRTQLAARGDLRDRLADARAHPDLVRAHRHLHLEGGYGCVLEDRRLARGRLVDVLRDDVQRLAGARGCLLGADRVGHGRADVGRQVGGSTRNKSDDAVEKCRKQGKKYPPRAAMTITPLDWTIVALSIVVSFIPAVLLARRAGSSSAEFFASGRSAPWWLIGVSMVATTFSTHTPNPGPNPV